jgi:mycothiol synthase
MLRPAELPADRAAITALLDAVTEADGHPPLSEEPRLDLERGPAHHPGLVAVDDGVVVGYAHLRRAGDAVVVELAVRPERRPELIGSLLETVVEAARPHRLRMWAGDEATATAARALGMAEARAVVRMERSLPLGVAPPDTGEARIARFRPGADEDAYLLVSNEAFAGHPDTGGWDRAVLADRMGREWFDPGGVFIAWERGRPVGLCFTKLHPDGLGEIYAVAVRPDAAGRGLGRALTVRGLSHLAGTRGARRGMVYTDVGNRRAAGLYENLGFRVVRTKEEFVA